MGVRDINLTELYEKYNKLYFNNELTNNINVEWSARMVKNAGFYKYKGSLNKRIALSVHYHERNPEEIINTLVHEMIHVKYPNAGHDSVFLQEMRTLNQKHNLNITVYSKEPARIRYMYTCKKCGYEYKLSHRLSHLPYRCCGKCKGQLIERCVK